MFKRFDVGIKQMMIVLLVGLISSAAVAEVSERCPGEQGYLFINNYDGNPTTGGFVSNSADVDVTVRIAPTAAVCGSASVLDKARVYGYAVITDEAVVEGEARVYGKARVQDHAIIRGEASVSGDAIIFGEAVIEGDAVVRGWFRAEKDSIDSGLHAPEDRPEEEINQVAQVKIDARKFCEQELVNQCLKWDGCDGFTKGDCAKQVIHDFNKVISHCHENNLYEKIKIIEEGYYKRFIVVNGEKHICNSDDKKDRTKELEVVKKEEQVDPMIEWCEKNTPNSIERRARQCTRKCDQMTGYKQTPKAYYDACMAICGKNKRVRSARFDKRC